MQNTIKAIKLKNYHLPFLLDILNCPMKGSDSRVRNRFVELISPHLKETEKNQNAIFEQYADKDENGKTIIMEGKKFHIAPDNVEKANKEYTELMEEEYIIDVLPSNENTLKEIKRILEETEKKMDLREGSLYDDVLKQFESIEL